MDDTSDRTLTYLLTYSYNIISGVLSMIIVAKEFPIH